MSNPMEYEFNFQLEIRGPCLLAGEQPLPRPREAPERRGPPGGEGFGPQAAGMERKGRQGGDRPRWRTSSSTWSSVGPYFLLSSMWPKDEPLPRRGFKAAPTSASMAPLVLSPLLEVAAVSCSLALTLRSRIPGGSSRILPPAPTPGLLVPWARGMSWALDNSRIPGEPNMQPEVGAIDLMVPSPTHLRSEKDVVSGQECSVGAA